MLMSPKPQCPLSLRFWYHWKAFDEKGALWFHNVSNYNAKVIGYWTILSKEIQQNIMKIGENFNTLETSLDECDFLKVIF